MIRLIRVVAIVVLIGTSACFTVRVGAGIAVPSDDAVGVQAGLTLGMNIPAGRRRVMSISETSGFGGPNGNVSWLMMGADWYNQPSSVGYRLGARIGGRATKFIPDTDEQGTYLLGGNAAFLYAITKPDPTKEGTFAMNLQHSVGVEAQLEILTDGALFGYGLGYMGIVYQFDGLLH